MVEIPRLPECRTWAGDIGEGGLGWFWWKPFPEDAGEVIIRCPHGHLGTLSREKHQVAADGTVSPSIHFKGLCRGLPEFHENGRLVGWTAADAARRSGSAPIPESTISEPGKA